MFWIGAIVGVVCGFLFASLLVAGEDDTDIRTARIEGMKIFAMKLKEKVQKPEFPWEDFIIYESDVDELLKEMEGAM